MLSDLSSRLGRLALLSWPSEMRTTYGQCALDSLRDQMRGTSSESKRLWTLAAGLCDLVIQGALARLQDMQRESMLRLPVSKGRPGMLEETKLDLSYALRSLMRMPVFAAAAIATIAIGVGATTGMFSIVNGVLLTALPYPDHDRLAFVFQTDRINGTTREFASTPDYFDYLERQRSFESLSAMFLGNPTLSSLESGAERVAVSFVTSNFFETMGTLPAIGRAFNAEEDIPGGPNLMVLTHGYWQSRFGADASIVGSSVNVDDTEYEVIGVMPESFRPLGTAEAYAPIQIEPTSGNRGSHGIGVVGKLRAGVDVQTAQADIAAIMAELEEEYPEDNVGRGANVVPLLDVYVANARGPLYVLFGAVGLVLLMACANVATLLFIRGSARNREVAVRAAVGAGRGRVIRQFMIESLVLAGLGSVAGVTLAYVGVAVIIGMNPANLPRMDSIAVDGRVLLFAGAVATVSAVLFGLAPALRSSRVNLVDSLREGGRGASDGASLLNLRSTLTTVQIAMAFMLLFGSALLGRSLMRLNSVDPGFAPESLVAASVSLPTSRYPNDFREWPEAPQVKAFFGAVLEDLRSRPGVERVALAVNTPTNRGWTTRMTLPDGPQTVEEGVEEEVIRPVSSGYFATVGINLMQGRDFTTADATGPAVVVVNQAFANKYFSDRPALGSSIVFWGQVREVVGVVDNVRFAGVGQAVEPAVYAPLD